MIAPMLGLVVGPIGFEEPGWLWLVPVVWAAAAWMSRRSLSGLGGRTRWVALGVRLAVLALMVGAVARPQWRTRARDVAVTAILDSSRSIPLPKQRAMERYVEEVRRAHDGREDRLGVVTVAERALAQSLPSSGNTVVERANIGGDLGSHLAEGVRMAMAIRPPDAAYRLLLISDGNETEGSLLGAAEAARAAGIPIDVLPVRLDRRAEVTAEQLVAPATARIGETISVRVAIRATSAARARLSLLLNDEPLPLDEGGGLGRVVELAEGSNVFSLPVVVPRSGPLRLRTVVEALPDARGVVADAVAENNEALGVTFATGEGRVLVVAPETELEAYRPLVDLLLASRIEADLMPVSRMPMTLTELNAYEAIVLGNTPAYELSQQTQEDLRQYVHDSGGGLVMLGGPQAFGAGGWLGSPLAEALPVRMDPPQKRQMPRGALMIISHSVEMPDGRTWGKRTAEAAVDALSRLDLAGLVEYRGGALATLVHPLTEVGDGSAIKRSINSLIFGDMQDYRGAFDLCIQALSAVEAGAKHIILITDGDAAPPSTQQIQQLRKERITVSTVGVFPHIPSDLVKLRGIAQATGGRAYEVVDQGGLGQIVQIFIKEAQTVRRSLIWEGPPFVPSLVPTAAENFRGIGGVPPISGYIVTGDREGLATVTLRGPENDPISAQWQHGLGRVFVLTSDATSRWSAAWGGWAGARAFWEQTLRWAMRPSGNANVRVTTQREGGRTRVIVDALDPAGDRLNFATFVGRVAGPGGIGSDVRLEQVGPGRYEGWAETAAAGTHVISLRFVAPGVGGQPLEGSVQAAVTKPFADEFRALEENLPLLLQVASMTGGRVLSGDPRTDRPWRRDGLTMPVAATPIWSIVAMIGIGLFLADVGVRRVRVDLGAIVRFFTARSARTKAGAQIGALKAAREQARRGLERRSSGGGDAAGTGSATAGVKFDASAEALRRAGESDPTVRIDASPADGLPTKPAGPVAPKAPPPEGGLARLKQAKKRAQEDME